MAWGEYFRTIQHKQLSGAEPVLNQFREFVTSFPSANTVRQKVILIDQLIHGFHWALKEGTRTRPVAINLIEGKLSQVIAFLDDLTYSEKSTPGLSENLAEWDKNIEDVRWLRKSRGNK